MSLFDSGIRPAIDEHLLEESRKVRDYGNYWSASSAGYCMRKQIFERLGVPHIEKDGDARKQRVFTAGHIFHDWIQGITKQAGLSITQELELQDEDLMIRGHIDDLVLIPQQHGVSVIEVTDGKAKTTATNASLVLYDYKTQNSRAFTYQKGKPISFYHKMQLGTYMYMLRKGAHDPNYEFATDYEEGWKLADLTEARILKISKDDLRMDENLLLWSDELFYEISDYWNTLNQYWDDKKIPPCTCHKHEGGFLAKELYNPYFYEGEPCSLALYEKFKEAAV